ncbi:MAG: ribulose-phosphate 3-epimerase [Candidatus Omnitrophota bacterium]
MQKEIKVAPSVIAADQSRLAEEVKKAQLAGADLLHIDVMDGHFVPNITIGPGVTKDLNKVTDLPLDAHLMIAHPEQYIQAFSDAGADYITFHIEACKKNAAAVIAQIKALKRKAGISLNPATPLSAIKKYLDDVDLVLVMSVNPGFYGQAFIPEVLPKLRNLRKLFQGEIAVDGGINEQTAAEVVAAGADILAAGSYIFKAQDMRKAIESLKKCRR